MVWYFFCCRKMGANMEKMQKNADYYEKSADCAAGIGKNMRYDTIFLMRTEKKSHVIYKKDIT